MNKILLLLFLVMHSFYVIAIPKTNKHCVMVAIDNYMHENADDYKSIEYIIKGNLIEHDSGMFSQKIKFRAKNRYGAYAVTEYYFTVTHNNGNSKVVSIDSVLDVQKLVRSGQLVIVNWYMPCDGSRISNKDLQKI